MRGPLTDRAPRWGLPSPVLQSTARRARGHAFLMQPFLVRSVRLVALLALAVLGGCSTTAVRVEGDFPMEPVIERLPISIAVHFDEEFSAYQLDEPIPQRGDWNIAIGQAQVDMFRAVLPAMFERVVELDDPSSAAEVDAVLIPRVDDMQFAIPFQTKSNFFEVWIRYELTLTEPGGGDVIASWPLTAYGRTRDAVLEGAEAAIQQAAVMALRDAAAFLAIDFADTRALAPWLDDVLDGREDEDPGDS